MAALNKFGFGSVGLEVEDFDVPDKVIQLGVPPVRVDIVTSITGVSWEEAFANKRALGRKKDLADLEAIGEE